MRRLVLLTAVLMLLTGCGLPSLPGLPGSSGAAGAGAGLWPDVPPLPDSKQVDVDLPLPGKMLVKGFVSAARSGNEDGQEAKDWEFKVYQAAGPGTDVGGFYRTSLTAQGWVEGEDACGGSSPVASVMPGGALCLFTKPTANGFTDNLAIVVMPGEGDGGADQVAYVRFASKG